MTAASGNIAADHPGVWLTSAEEPYFHIISKKLLSIVESVERLWRIKSNLPGLVGGWAFTNFNLELLYIALLTVAIFIYTFVESKRRRFFTFLTHSMNNPAK